MSHVIDLRSDTVTRPTPAMLQAMMSAEVGDDVLGDDPTVKRLQEKFAALLGKEAACFVPSGTMANQTAIRALTQPGDEVIAHAESHIIHYETGGPAALSGVMVRALSGARGQFDAQDVADAARPESLNAPASRLVVIENTQNRGCGSVWPLEKVRAVSAAARKAGLKVHMDGARLWNASVASGVPMASFAACVDTVSCCFSKGLGTPVGSAVAGDAATIARVFRFRKMFGGAMRQSGILAAAAMHAMDHHVARLAEDHANAKRFAQGIMSVRGLALAPDQSDGPETNLVFFDLAKSLGLDAAGLCTRLKERGVHMLPSGPYRVRAVTHLNVTGEMIDHAVRAVRDAVTSPA